MGQKKNDIKYLKLGYKEECLVPTRKFLKLVYSSIKTTQVFIMGLMSSY